MHQAGGSDLGTTFSSLAFVEQTSQARAMPDVEGALAAPPVALWDTDDFLAGHAAFGCIQQTTEEEHQNLETSLIRGVRRMIGRSSPGSLFSSRHSTAAVEVSIALPGRLAHNATAHPDFSVRDIVFPVSAYLVEQKRAATRTAAEGQAYLSCRSSTSHALQPWHIHMDGRYG